MIGYIVFIKSEYANNNVSIEQTTNIMYHSALFHKCVTEIQENNIFGNKQKNIETLYLKIPLRKLVGQIRFQIEIIVTERPSVVQSIIKNFIVETYSKYNRDMMSSQCMS